jgi:Cu/Ag efflux protein CusF
MRKLILTIVLALAAAGAHAQEDKALAQPAPAKDTTEMTGVVIATDTTSKTITVKKDTDPMLSELQPEKTLAVDAKAEASLKSVKVGDKVRLVLKSDAAGKEVVSNIEKPQVGAPEKQ